MTSADTVDGSDAVSDLTPPVRPMTWESVRMEELREQLQRALDEVGVDARAVVCPTPWSVGPVSAYLFPHDPITLIDSGVNTAAGLAALEAALGAEGLKPEDVAQVIVTHAHTDHFGGAVMIQEQADCPVYLHRADIAISDPSSWQDGSRRMFLPLGFTEDMLDRLFGGEEPDFEWKAPTFTPMDDGATFATGAARLRVEHHAGHSPGHVWVVDDTTGAIFVGDYMLANHPTNAGLELDEAHPTGRAQLLGAYNEGLCDLMSRTAPALFPAHGPPITDHHDMIGRRLEKTNRRTRHVAGALSTTPESALAVARHLYGARAEANWEIMADLVGRLDLLVAEGHATSTMGEDGVWYFRKIEDRGI